ncbi:hypothetical protein K461DRAFT_298102 [Myriangium duriaei CBS 260.36]|uniref:Short-chain dehydrogenase n=1 Tax=Myriangium duriaei CBS 260.36 TaxID=1168546 RepID=A0A9P4ITE6_9PEZI|nr:hypothetical protein K461DRAFT_298102 [Myriangium duriaei CBS 260.36]
MAPIALILGSGPRVGSAVAKSFANAGYSIAIAARKGTDAKTDEGYYSIRADFADPSSMPGVFHTVVSIFGAPPSVVVYNAASLTPPANEKLLLSIPAARVGHDLNVDTVSPYVAAQEALKGWESLPIGLKLFIYTGNAQNKLVLPIPMMLDLGMGKAASAYWIGQADGAYEARGYRFIYADERTEEGKLKGMTLDGHAHGEFYTQLAKSSEGIPWNATFVKGKGYVAF